MTPREKAEELVDKMYFSRRYDDTENYIPQRAHDHAKQCALIAVDEILNSFYNVFDDFVVESSKTGGYRNMKNYWREVEREILNMKGGDK